MAIAEVSIIPLGTKTPSVSNCVACACRALKDEKNIKCEITPNEKRFDILIQGKPYEIEKRGKRGGYLHFGRSYLTSATFG